MNGNFELNKPGWFALQLCELNSFLNDKLTSDQYGKWYSVKFTGDAETYLWQTKTEPVIGEKYWGWLEKTTSGKSVKFKWDKQNAPANLPSGQPTSYTKDQTIRNQEITLNMVWKTLITISGVPKNGTEFTDFFITVAEHANELLLMSEHMKQGNDEGQSKDE